MNRVQWEEENKERERKALERHERLHQLFKKNRFAFEMERKKELDAFFKGIKDKDRRKRLKNCKPPGMRR